MRFLSSLFLCGALCAQTFEVASVKLSGPDSPRGSNGGPGTSDPGRYRFRSAMLLDLLAVAHGVEYFQVSGKTALDRDRYDLIANVPDGATKEQFRVMLRNLLAERFRMKWHKETREFPAYELVVAKSGPKLNQPRPAGEGFPDLPPGKPGMMANNSMRDRHWIVRIRARQMPMSELVRFLHRPAEPPVVDRTGLTDKYDFTLEYEKAGPSASPDAIPDAPVLPTVFAALQQQLGLQLVSKRLPFDVIVVDSFERIPTEN